MIRYQNCEIIHLVWQLIFIRKSMGNNFHGSQVSDAFSSFDEVKKGIFGTDPSTKRPNWLIFWGSTLTYSNDMEYDIAINLKNIARKVAVSSYGLSILSEATQFKVYAPPPTKYTSSMSTLKSPFLIKYQLEHISISCSTKTSYGILQTFSMIHKQLRSSIYLTLNWSSSRKTGSWRWCMEISWTETIDLATNATSTMLLKKLKLQQIR